MNTEIKSTTIYNTFRCVRYFNIIMSLTTCIGNTVHNTLQYIGSTVHNTLQYLLNKQKIICENVSNTVHFNYLRETRAPCITMCTTM